MEDREMQKLALLKKNFLIFFKKCSSFRQKSSQQSLKTLQKAIELLQEIVVIETDQRLKSQQTQQLVKLKNQLKSQKEKGHENHEQMHEQQKKKDDNFLIISPQEMDGTWVDVIGNEKAKICLKEVIEKEEKNILIYGPEGCGKTFLTKALAKEAKRTLFCISSNLLNKYETENEKKVRYLFEKARTSQPSIIFFDEIDCFSTGERENETWKRVLPQLLSHLTKNSEKKEEIFFIASTSAPKNIHHSLQDIFTKRIYIPPPNQSTKIKIFQKELQKISHSMEEQDIIGIVKKTQNFSCTDIQNLVKDATFSAISKLQQCKRFKLIGQKYYPYFGDDDGIVCSWTDIEREKLQFMVDKNDFDVALKKIKPSIHASQLEDYQIVEQQWNKS